MLGVVSEQPRGTRNTKHKARDAKHRKSCVEEGFAWDMTWCSKNLKMPGVAEAVQVVRGEEGEADMEETEEKMLSGRVSLGLQERGSKCDEMLLWSHMRDGLRE